MGQSIKLFYQIVDGLITSTLLKEVVSEVMLKFLPRIPVCDKLSIVQNLWEALRNGYKDARNRPYIASISTF